MTEEDTRELNIHSLDIYFERKVFWMLKIVSSGYGLLKYTYINELQSFIFNQFRENKAFWC